MTLTVITPTDWPTDQPSWKMRREAEKIAANFVTLNGFTQPVGKYTANTATADETVTGPEVAGADNVVLNMTGALAAGRALTLPTAAAIVAAITDPYVGKTYRLRIMNTSSGNFDWTVTTNTGLTLTGTMTIAQNTYREFLVTLTSLTAVAIQSLGQVAAAA